jgi:hypothetical protein
MASIFDHSTTTTIHYRVAAPRIGPFPDDPPFKRRILWPRPLDRAPLHESNRWTRSWRSTEDIFTSPT